MLGFFNRRLPPKPAQRERGKRLSGAAKAPQAGAAKIAPGFAEEEAELVKSIAEADLRGFSPTKRIHLRLRLSELQRKHAVGLRTELGGAPDAAWLTAAEASVRQAIALAAQTKNVQAYIASLDQLADVFGSADNWRGAETMLREAVNLQQADYSGDPYRNAHRLQRLGIAQQRIGQPELAAESLEESLDRFQQLLDPEQVETADYLADIGRAFRALGSHDRAADCLREAHRVHRARLGEGAPQTLSDLQQLAATLDEAGQADESARMYEALLSVKQRQLGPENYDQLGLMQFSLANLYIKWDNPARARELLIDVIGAFRRGSGPRLAVAYETLAQVEEASGRYLSAVRELENAGKAWERCGPDRVQELVRNLEYRAGLLEELRKPREAAWLRQKAQEKLGQEPSTTDALGHAT